MRRRSSCYDRWLPRTEFVGVDLLCMIPTIACDLTTVYKHLRQWRIEDLDSVQDSHGPSTQMETLDEPAICASISSTAFT